MFPVSTGRARDELISRAKIVLNINFYSASKIFEVARVAYLLSNRKAVVALDEPGISIDSDLAKAVQLSPPSSFLKDCTRLVDNLEDRQRLEELGYSIICKRDVRVFSPLPWGEQACTLAPASMNNW
jgi:hypothetical protein